MLSFSLFFLSGHTALTPYYKAMSTSHFTKNGEDKIVPAPK